MPRCSICTNPQRAEIDKALVAGESLRDIAGRFGTSRTTLGRHKNDHLGEQIERAERQHAVIVNNEVAKRETKRDAESLDVMGELRNIFTKMNKMLDACDVWLSDPDDPSVYSLGPRAHEVWITYEVVIGQGPSGNDIVKRKKATLQSLVDRVEEKGIGEVTLAEHKAADPRKLILETAALLKGSTEFLAKLIGQLDERPQINFLVTPEWQALRAELVRALRPYPDARAAVVGRMLALKAGGGE